MTAPIGKLVRYKAMATGDIHNPGPGLKALRHNPRLHMIRPPPVPTPTLNNITPPNKPIHTIRHARPPSVTEDLLAGASPNENARNQWDGDAAYDTAYLTSFDQRYIDFYFGSGFYARTALYRWAMTNSGCCSWRWVEQELLAGELTPGETEAIQLNLRWQIRAGMTISFPEALTRQKGALGLAADPGLDHDDVEELWAREGAAIEAVAQMLHLRLCQLPLPSRRPELTLRQREALEWIAEGKTNQDVATLMGVSIATIEKHLRLARQALDVDTTAQAIAKAMASNNIFRLGPDIPKK